jgi:hypothetical protein
MPVRVSERRLSAAGVSTVSFTTHLTFAPAAPGGVHARSCRGFGAAAVADVLAALAADSLAAAADVAAAVADLAAAAADLAAPVLGRFPSAAEDVAAGRVTTVVQVDSNFDVVLASGTCPHR